MIKVEVEEKKSTCPNCCAKLSYTTLEELAKSLPRGVDFAASKDDAATGEAWELVFAGSNVVDILEGICAHGRAHMDGQNRFQYVLAARDTGNVLIGPFYMVYDHDVANFRMFKVEI